MNAYQQLTEATNGHDVIVKISVSVLSQLLDSSVMHQDSKQLIIDQAIKQIEEEAPQ